MMRKAIFAFATLLLAPMLATQAKAEGFMDNKYVVVKALTFSAGSVEHGAHLIEGEAGTGFGIDLGCKIADGVALELAYTQGGMNVTEDHSVHGTATFFSTGVLVAKTFHLSDSFSLLAKIGFAREGETLDFHGTTSTSDHLGSLIVLGGEYKLFEHNELVFEYESSSVEGPKGANIFLGYKYAFGSGH